MKGEACNGTYILFAGVILCSSSTNKKSMNLDPLVDDRGKYEI